MKRNPILIALVFVTLFLSPQGVFAQRGTRGETIDVRLASPMPRSSDWGRTLDRIAAEWARVTNNEVRLIIIHDGLEGGESKMLTSLAANNIQAALFTSFGLAAICPAVMTLSAPFLIRNDNELDLVLRNVQPLLDAQVSRTNFVVVAWSKGGWVNIFSTEPVFVPADLRRHRIATNPESVDLNTAFRTMGFHLVETDMTDLGTRIANNMVNAIYQAPAAVAPVRLHRNLGNMMNMPIAPFLGGIVMNRITWNRLRPEQQRAIVSATQRIAVEFDSAMPRVTTNAVSAMSRDGLRVNRITGEHEAQWRAELDRVMPSLLGTTFDREVYQRIVAVLEQSRGGR